MSGLRAQPLLMIKSGGYGPKDAGSGELISHTGHKRAFAAGPAVLHTQSHPIEPP